MIKQDKVFRIPFYSFLGRYNVEIQWQDLYGKGRFATQSRFNDFHTNLCIFLSFQTALKLFLRNMDFHPCTFIIAYLTHGKNWNLSSVCGAQFRKITLEGKTFSFVDKSMEFSSV